MIYGSFVLCSLYLVHDSVTSFSILIVNYLFECPSLQLGHKHGGGWDSFIRPFPQHPALHLARRELSRRGSQRSAK